MANSIQLLVQPIPGSSKVTLYASDPKIKPRTVNVATAQELFAEFRIYKSSVIQQGAQVDVTMPNIFQAFCQSRYVQPVPKFPACTVCNQVILAGDQIVENKQIHARCANSHVEEKFEVNMMEALVGWKCWNMSVASVVNTTKTMVLRTTNDFVWNYETIAEARCPNKGTRGKQSPTQSCTCGIYAADKMQTAVGYGNVRGQIYGWGRYVRGTDGWRAQFAYPKNFMLDQSQVDLIEALKPYRVPIYVEMPTIIYSPVEDGYEGESDDEYRNAQEDWSSGTREDPDAQEA